MPMLSVLGSASNYSLKDDEMVYDYCFYIRFCLYAFSCSASERAGLSAFGAG